MKPYNNIYMNLLENHHFNILMILTMVKITKYQGLILKMVIKTRI